MLWSVLKASNYLYVMEWIFRDDGAVVARAGSTGPKLAGPDDPVGHAHTFTWRIDFDLNGAEGDSVHKTWQSRGFRRRSQARGPSSASRARSRSSDARARRVGVHEPGQMLRRRHEDEPRDEDRDTVPILWVSFQLEPHNVFDVTPFFDVTPDTSVP